MKTSNDGQPPKPSIDDLIEQAIGFARHELVGKPDATLLPSWLILGAKRTTIVGTPFSDEFSKEFAAYTIRKMLKEEKATSYSFISEAWMAHESLDNPIGLAPRDRMDRKEIVMVNAFNLKGEGKHRVFETIRGADGVIVELKAMPEVGEADRFGGRFFNLFDEA